MPWWARISWTCTSARGAGVAVVTLAIDNLGKGMAGSAVQNLNLMFDLEARMGLDRPGAGL